MASAYRVVSKSTCYPFLEYYFGRLKKYTTITYMYTNVYFDFIILIVQGPYRDHRETAGLKDHNNSSYGY